MSNNLDERNLLAAERVSVFMDMLSKHNLPFHWKQCETPADMYDGGPFNVTAKILVDVEDLFDFLCKHEISYVFGTRFDAKSEKQSLRDLWVGQDYYGKNYAIYNNIKAKIIDNVVEIHEDDEMVAFYDTWVQDTKIFIRSARLA